MKFKKSSTEPILVKLGTKHSSVKEIQVCSEEGQCPFPRGDNTCNIEVEIHLPRLKIFFRTTGSVSTKLGAKQTWLKGTQGFTNKDHSILKKEIVVYSSPNQCYDVFRSFAHMCLMN